MMQLTVVTSLDQERSASAHQDFYTVVEGVLTTVTLKTEHYFVNNSFLSRNTLSSNKKLIS